MAENLTRCLELREEEIVAISSIYEDSFTQISEHSFEIRIVCDDDSWWSITVRIEMPPLYPKFDPPMYEIFSECLKDEDSVEIKHGLDEIWNEFKGECVLFMFIEKCKEILHERKEKSPKQPVEEEYVDAQDFSSVNEVMQAAINDNKTINEEARLSGQKTEFIAEDSCILKPDAPEIISGETIVDRKSIFQGHVAYVETEEEVRKVLQRLKENRKIARASHNIMAYRLAGSRKDTFLQDYDDDGENEAGGRLMHLLQILNAKNIVVIVSRWYGGILLGPDRFKHINNCAREIIVKSGIFTETKEQKTAKSKKKVKKIK